MKGMTLWVHGLEVAGSGTVAGWFEDIVTGT